MTDDFNSEENKQKLRDDFNVYCKDIDLANVVGESVQTLLTAQILKLKFGYNLLITGDLEDVFVTAREIEENNTQIFSLMRDEFKKFSFCSLVERLDLVEIKGKLEEELGGTLEDKIEEAKIILEDLEVAIESLQDSDELDIETFESALNGLVENEDSKLHILDEKIANFFIDLLVEMSKKDNDEVGYEISEDLEKELRAMSLLDLNFDFSEYFSLVVEKIFIGLSKDTEEKQSDYLDEYNEVIASNKVLVKTFETVENIDSYLVELIPDVFHNLDSSLLKVDKYFSDNLNFNDFIISYRFLNVELRNLMNLVNQNFTLLAFRMLDLYLEDMEFSLNYAITQYEIDYASELGYADSETILFDENLRAGSHMNVVIKIGKTSCSNEMVRISDNEVRYNYYLILGQNAYKEEKYNRQHKVTIGISGIDSFRIDCQNDESIFNEYKNRLYEDLIKPSLSIGEDNLDFIKDFFLNSMLEVVSEKPFKETEDGKFLTYSDIEDTYTIVDVVDVHDEVETIMVLENYGNNGFPYGCTTQLPYASNLKKEDREAQQRKNDLFWSTHHLNYPKDPLPNFIFTESDEPIKTYHFNFKDFFYDFYNSDDFVTIDNYTDEQRNNFVNQLPYVEDIKNLWNEGVKEYTEVRDEVIDFTDEVTEEVSTMLDEGYAWLRELLKYRS